MKKILVLIGLGALIYRMAKKAGYLENHPLTRQIIEKANDYARR